MSDEEKIMKLFLESAILLDKELLKGRSMRDVLLDNSMKESISSDCILPMDFKYAK